MRDLIDKISNRMLLWGIKGSEVGEIDGIVLYDMRKRGDSFQQTLESALRIIQKHDPRRYARVVRHISKIVNHILKPGTLAQYHFKTRAVTIEFDDFPRVSREVREALYASVLVHEATHGEIAARGIIKTVENRGHIERLCIAEQNRFAARLTAQDDRYKLSQVNFKESYWDEAWNTRPVKQMTSILWRTATESKLKQKDDASSEGS